MTPDCETTAKQISGPPAGTWPGCGYEYLKRDPDHRLRITTDFLRYLFHRPELAPIPESCTNERALHQALITDPGRAVGEMELRAMSDTDVRENYRIALGFRDLLVDRGTIEQAYLALASGKAAQMTPPVLVDMLVQLLLEHILAGETDPFLWRAAELFFRPQRVSLNSGVLLADAETLTHQQEPSSITLLQRLIQEAQGTTGASSQHLVVLNRNTAESYWSQTEPFTVAFSLSTQEPGIQALCRVLERWLEHFHGLASRITPVARITDWYWHIGLDSESNRILNSLYRQETVSEQALHRLLALFSLELTDNGRLHSDLAEGPLHLGIAMTEDGWLRLKPQNLLLNLPFKTPA